MTAPVDTSAENVEAVATDMERFAVRGWCDDEAAVLLRALAKERAEQETLLAERNRQNAAAFTASDAYQKRCEQGDALLRRASGVYRGFGILSTDVLSAIDAHLAGEDMGRKL